MNEAKRQRNASTSTTPSRQGTRDHSRLGSRLLLGNYPPPDKPFTWRRTPGTIILGDWISGQAPLPPTPPHPRTSTRARLRARKSAAVVAKVGSKAGRGDGVRRSRKTYGGAQNKCR